MSDFIQLVQTSKFSKLVELGFDVSGDVAWHRTTDIDGISVLSGNKQGTYVFDLAFEGTSFDRLISSEYISNITLQSIDAHTEMLFITEKPHKHYTLCLLVDK